MKALIRNEGETITEDMDIPCIDWNTGAPLTNEKWYRGPYKLVENYVPPVAKKDIVHPEQQKIEEKIVEDDNYVIIDGKKYSKEELRSLLE